MGLIPENLKVTVAIDKLSAFYLAVAIGSGLLLAAVVYKLL